MPTANRAPKIQDLESRRYRRACEWLAWHREERSRRLRETRALFGEPVVVVDPHTHSAFSDGIATIAMNRDAGLAAGIDLVFATDHNSLGQRRAVRHIRSMSWGQEPGALHHHIGLLCNRRRFRPREDSIAADVARARALAPFVWIPHPAGWYPRTWYSREQTDALWTLGPSFAMEVINGAHKIGKAFDAFDEAAVTLWDRLLCAGRRVTPLGASDAHLPEGIGCCWTALPGRARGVAAVLKGLAAGCCMASEAGLIAISIAGLPMGSTVVPGRRRRLALRFRVADAAGLQSVRLVAGGKVRKQLHPRGATLVEGEWSFAPGHLRYVRVEASAVDDRRVFSAPIYLSE